MLVAAKDEKVAFEASCSDDSVCLEQRHADLSFLGLTRNTTYRTSRRRTKITIAIAKASYYAYTNLQDTPTPLAPTLVLLDGFQFE